MPQGAAVKIRGDLRDIAQGAASAALLISSGPPSTPGWGEKTRTGRRPYPVQGPAAATPDSAPSPPDLGPRAFRCTHCFTSSEGSPSLLFQTRDGRYDALVGGGLALTFPGYASSVSSAKPAQCCLPCSPSLPSFLSFLFPSSLLPRQQTCTGPPHGEARHDSDTDPLPIGAPSPVGELGM